VRTCRHAGAAAAQLLLVMMRPASHAVGYTGSQVHAVRALPVGCLVASTEKACTAACRLPIKCTSCCVRHVGNCVQRTSDGSLSFVPDQHLKW
jgi:hypothetical protein